MSRLPDRVVGTLPRDMTAPRQVLNVAKVDDGGVQTLSCRGVYDPRTGAAFEPLPEKLSVDPDTNEPRSLVYGLGGNAHCSHRSPEDGSCRVMVSNVLQRMRGIMTSLRTRVTIATESGLRNWRHKLFHDEWGLYSVLGEDGLAILDRYVYADSREDGIADLDIAVSEVKNLIERCLAKCPFIVI